MIIFWEFSISSQSGRESPVNRSPVFFVTPPVEERPRAESNGSPGTGLPYADSIRSGASSGTAMSSSASFS